MSDNRLRSFQVGDTVKWTGQAAGGRKDHEGVIESNDSRHATVKCEKRHKKTGKLLGYAIFRPYLSQLTLVKAAPNTVEYVVAPGQSIPAGSLVVLNSDGKVQVAK